MPRRCEPPSFFDRLSGYNPDEVDRILAHCGRVIDLSRRLRAESRDLQERIADAHRGSGPGRSRLGRGAPRLGRLIPLRGGAGALAGVRILLVTDDPDLRDLTRLLFEWYGATAAIVSVAQAVEMAGQFRPDLVLVDLPFDRRETFALPSRLRVRAPLVAITRHGRDHPAHEAIKAGFTQQLNAPFDPDGFEVMLAQLVRKRAA